jgi:hypothetical protein
VELARNQFQGLRDLLSQFPVDGST